MKTFFKKIFCALAIIAGVSLTTSLVSPSRTYAIDCNVGSFLGLTAWCSGVGDFNNESAIIAGVSQIASNIFTDISVIAAYLVIGYVIYGGYLYMFSSGDASKAAAGKKTLTHAFTGLAIVMLANVILNAIRIALLGANGKFSNCIGDACVDANTMVTNAIQWVIGIAGVVSAVFIVIGGIGYMTSSGDSSKLQKSKSTILYALIGLAIVALAEAITAFVSNLIRNA